MKTPSKATLRKAVKVLQDAHDYIEQFGFDISTYTGGTYGYGPYGPSPRRCYIGTVRGVMGLYPGVTRLQGPSEGDGPELVLAFQALDDLAKSRLRHLPPGITTADWREYLCGELGERWETMDQTGRFIERLGFLVKLRAERRFPGDEDKVEEYQRAYALKILREALTKVYG